MKSTLGKLVLVLAALLVGTEAFAGIVKGPYLLFEGSNTGMAVLWQTDVSETDQIRWGTDQNYSMGQAASTEYGDHQHKFTITGLQPGTRYYYQIDGYGSGSFQTAPPADATSVKLLAYGDTRTYPSDQELVVARMRSAYAADPAFQTITLHSGDWVSGNTESEWSTQFFVNSNPAMHAFQAEVPIAGVRGNHEGSGEIFRKYFPFPHVAGFYWSFDYGPAHVVVLDEYVSYAPGSAQYTWLTNDLASSAKRWKIVMSHEPGWSAGGGHPNNQDIQRYIQPLCKQYGVDLVVNGHNHYYSRAVVDGVQHITTGGGGAPLNSPDLSSEFVVAAEGSHHYLEIDIQDTELTVTARRDAGSIIDMVTVTRGSSANLPPLAAAGPDQTVVDADGSGAENVILNGSASSDPDGVIAGYTWSEGSTAIATGATPVVNLAVGTHMLTLTVTDNLGATASDQVQVTVQAAALPGSFVLISPPSGARQVSKTPAFDWSDAAGAQTYTIVVSRNRNLSSPVISQTGLTSSSYAPGVALAGRTKYYWRVTATNAGGSRSSSTYSFTTMR